MSILIDMAIAREAFEQAVRRSFARRATADPIRLQEICTSLTVPASAFGMSYARGYFGERASILGIPIDACLGLVMKIVGACFGLPASKGGQRVGKFFMASSSRIT